MNFFCRKYCIYLMTTIVDVRIWLYRTRESSPVDSIYKNLVSGRSNCTGRYRVAYIEELLQLFIWF